MTLDQIVGPRIPAAELRSRPARYALPTLFLSLAAILLVISIFLPYWQMTLLAPQYPGGLKLQAYLNRVVGDVHEIDGLNHYIGMRPLEQAAQLERTLSILGIVVTSLLVLAAIFIHRRLAAYLAVPAILFPGLFLGDLYFWLSHFGRHLDPHAPLSSAIKPFVPPVLGEGKIAQFRTIALPDAGLWLAFAAALLVIVGLYFHWRAYQPLVAATGAGQPGLANRNPRAVA